ncbi:hypothetical protein ACIA5G_33360 [Amycolatopsis sp. NPDC051758]|uniref:hypothetical protein n=1 Tax=Amycolatopsis sp. NPDC051758 TaxID=3363935 RepID=UPI0037B9CB2B
MRRQHAGRIVNVVTVSLVLPSITATEFGERMFRDRADVRSAHDPGYVARVILCALRTGEEHINIPQGPEQPMPAVPRRWPPSPQRIHSLPCATPTRPWPTARSTGALCWRPNEPRRLARLGAELISVDYLPIRKEVSTFQVGK